MVFELGLLQKNPSVKPRHVLSEVEGATAIAILYDVLISWTSKATWTQKQTKPDPLWVRESELLAQSRHSGSSL